MLGLEHETFGGLYPFAGHYRTVNGVRIHFVDAGSGEPVVLLHGDPTWGFLYRNFIPTLARRHRCIVPDHMGWGNRRPRQTPPVPVEPPHRQPRSAPARTGPARHHHGPARLGRAGWPGVAVRHPDQIKRLALMNTWAAAAWPGAPLPRLVEIIRSERGERFVVDRNGYLDFALAGLTLHHEKLTPAVMAAYRAPFPTPESRRALLCWSRDISWTRATPPAPR